MSRGRALLGWVALAVVAPVAALVVFAVGRGALGDSAVVGTLSPAQVSAALSSLGTPTPSPPPTSHPSAGPSTARPSSHPTAAGGGSSGSSRPSTRAVPTTSSHAPVPSTSPTGHAPPPSPSPSPTSPHTALVTSSGGSVVAQCSGSGFRTVYLVSWSPAQGYRVTGVDRGPAEEAAIEFESDHGSSSMTVVCRNGYPVKGYGGGGDD